MKQIFSLFLTFILICIAILPVSALDSVVHSRNGNFAHYQLCGNTLSVFGKLNPTTTADEIWLECGEVTYSTDPNCTIFDITPDEYFAAQIDLSSLNGTNSINLLYSPTHSSLFCSYQKLEARNQNGTWELIPTQDLKDDGAATDAEEMHKLILSNAEGTNAPIDVPETALTLSSSYNPNNYISATVNGNIVEITGKLILPDHDKIWVRLKNNDHIYQIVDFTSGEEFCVTLPLGISSSSDKIAFLFHPVGDSTYYYSYFNNLFHIQRCENEYVLVVPTFADQNVTMQNLWINPSTVFNREIPPEIKELSDSICEGISDPYQKLWALHCWVADNIYYDYDHFYHGKEVVTDPTDVLVTRRTVCVGYSKLLEALCEAQGIPAIYVGTYTGDDLNSFTTLPTENTHAHTEAWVDGRWIIMDSTWDSNNRYEYGKYETKPLSAIEYFDIPAEMFATNHIIIEHNEEEDLTNIPAPWAAEEIRTALRQHLIPDDLQSDYAFPITRGDFSKLIVNAILTTNVEVQYRDTISFTDTSDNYVLLAAALGIVNGYEDGSFRPGEPITREQAAAMLTRAAKQLNIASKDPLIFEDENAVSGWAIDSVRSVSGMISNSGMRVMGGVGNGFDPKGTYTRQQAILTVLRLIDCR